MWDNRKQILSITYESNNVNLSEIYYLWYIWYTGNFSEQKAKIGYESHISDICQEIIIFKFSILDKALVKNL